MDITPIESMEGKSASENQLAESTEMWFLLLCRKQGFLTNYGQIRPFKFALII
jgi:hypothetical protein